MSRCSASTFSCTVCHANEPSTRCSGGSGASIACRIAAAAFAGTKQRPDPVVPPGTATWSYLCFAANSANEVMEKANRAGAQGWEMVSAAQGHQGAIWCFRQPQWARPQPVD